MKVLLRQKILNCKETTNSEITPEINKNKDNEPTLLKKIT